MTRTPRPLLATGASTSLARQTGFALGPAPATLVWAVSSYELAGMRGAMALARALSASSVLVLVRMRVPGEQPAVEGPAS